MSDGFVDIARSGAAEAAYQVTTLLIALLIEREADSVTLPPNWRETVEESGLIYLVEERDGGTTVRLAPRVKRQDPRVPAGGWVQTITGMPVLVEGISQEELVIVVHRADEPEEHRADVPIEEFLRGHVPADGVALLGRP